MPARIVVPATLEVHDRNVTRRISSPVFVGRRAELDRLDDAFRRAAAGEPCLVLIAGEAGVGKSRLVAEFADRVNAAGGQALTGGCIDLGNGGRPYAPFAEAFRALVRRVDEDARAIALGPLTSTLARLVPNLGQAVADADPAGVETDPSARQTQILDAILAALGHVASASALAFIIEDIHWADGSTRDVIRFLVRNLDSERVAIVATYRSDDLHRRHPLMPLLAELERSSRVERLDLERFDRDELVAQLEGILGEVPPAGVVVALLERSNGIPFYVEELVASRSDDRSSLPTTLREILGLRLASLSDATHELVRTAAIVGGIAPHDRLTAVADMEPEALLAALGEAVEARILTSDSGPDGPAYAFRHELLREAASDELLPVQRARLHLRLADCLDAQLDALPAVDASLAADAALHAYEGHDLPRALRSGMRAVRALVAAAAYREALGHAERVLALWSRVEHAAGLAGIDHAELLVLASQVAAATDRPERAAALGREAVAELGSTGDVGRQAAMLADLYMFEWEAQQFDASSTSVQRAFELVEDAEPSRLKATVLWMMGWERWWAGSIDDAVDFLETAMADADVIGDRAVWADAAGALAHTVADLGHGTLAASLADRSAAAATDFDGRPMSLWVGADRSIAWWTAGRFDDAAHAASVGLELARRYGWHDRLGSGFATCLADGLFELGRYDEATTVLARLMDQGGNWNTRNWAAQTMSRIAIARGRLDVARQHLSDVVAIGSAGAAEFFVALVDVELVRAEGRFDALEAAVEAGLVGRSRTASVAGLWGLLGAAIGTAADWAVVARSRRRPGDASRAVALAEGWLADLGSIVDQGRSAGGAGPFIEATFATGAAELGRARAEPDPRAWAGAQAAWRALAQPYQAAYASLRLADSILATDGDRAAAGTALRDAYLSASTIGAAALAREIVDLADRGRLDLGRPDGTVVEPASDPTGVGLPSLTSREREVLRLVAAGHTNCEIGTNLFISEKTVSVHVSNAMAKLDALSRYEAAASAERLGLL